MAKILIVDDNEYTRMLLSNIIEGLGHETIQASNGPSAVETYKDQEPDMVFMDVIMEGMDGIEAVAAIKDLDPEAKVVMCSAQKHEALREEAEETGAQVYITKPFDTVKIKEVIERFI